MELEENLGANAQYDVLFGILILKWRARSKKVKVWLANERTKVIGLQVVKTVYWPIIDGPLYPTSHDWDGTSIPDLVEDKQRARAVAQNLGLDAMRADLYPMYIYDSNKITNREDLEFDFNKFVPIDAQNKSVGDAIMPLSRQDPTWTFLALFIPPLTCRRRKLQPPQNFDRELCQVNRERLANLMCPAKWIPVILCRLKCWIRAKKILVAMV